MAHFHQDIVCVSEIHSLNFQINNAGCMVNTREVTEDGLEKNFATNTLGMKISYSFLQHYINHYLLSYTCNNFAKVILMKLKHAQFQHSYLAWQNMTETAFKVNMSIQ